MYERECPLVDGTRQGSSTQLEFFRLVPSPPNSALQRAGTHKVLGRGRTSLPRSLVPRARVLIGWRAAAELGS
jgi:hypothetical protein